MRILCDSCGAKYSIADEKIAGKLFKVRCKRCSHMIMVDGTDLGGASASSGESSTAWYVVIDGAQTGPLSVDEVGAQLQTGTVDANTFAWREGMGDWKRLSEIGDFAAVLAAGGAAPNAGDSGAFEDEETRVVESSSALVSVVSEVAQVGDPAVSAAAESAASSVEAAVSSVEPAAPEASAVQAAASSVEAAAVDAAAPAPSEAAPSGAGLLSHAPTPAAEPAPEPSDFFSTAKASAPAATEPPADDAGAKMTGERNESSVLFSLSDLTSKKKEEDDLPRTEGSGLIDIRVLASAGSSPDAPADPMAAVAGPSAAAGSGGGTATMSMAPVVALPPRKTSSALIAVIGFGIVLLTVLVAVLVYVLVFKDQGGPPIADAPTPAAVEPSAVAEAPAAPAAAEPAPAEPAAAPVDPAPAAAADAGAPGEGSAMAAAEGDASAAAEAAVAVAAVADDDDEDEDEDNDSRRDDDEDDDDEGDSDEREAAAAPEPARDTQVARAEPSRDVPQRDSATDRNPAAVNRALEALRRGQDDEEPEAEPEPEPQSLTRDQVRSTIRRYRSRVSRCNSTEEEVTVNVSFVVQPSGNVTNVDSDDSGDIANCVVGVVRDMSFPRSSGDPVPVRYPFRP